MILYITVIAHVNQKLIIIISTAPSVINKSSSVIKSATVSGDKRFMIGFYVPYTLSLSFYE